MNSFKHLDLFLLIPELSKEIDCHPTTYYTSRMSININSVKTVDPECENLLIKGNDQQNSFKPFFSNPKLTITEINKLSDPKSVQRPHELCRLGEKHILNDIIGS